MLKKLLSIPNTFDPDDRRRRQVLRVILIICGVTSLIGILLSIMILLSTKNYDINRDAITKMNIGISGFIIYSILLLMNYSPRIPTWLTSTIFIAIVTALLMQSDTLTELYHGRSLLVWVIPIVLSTLIFPTGYQFLITLSIILMMMQFSPNPESSYASHTVNYYSMLVLSFITFISWFGQRISDHVVRDARKQAAGASRHAANLEAVLNSITDGVLVLDLNGHILSSNPALRRMIPEEELMKVIAQPIEKKIRWQRKLFAVTTSLVPEVGSVSVFRDETRRYEAERAKDSLLATASHELRTPLTAMMNYLEMIQTFIRMGKINTPEFDEYIGRAIENAHRLRQLVNNILDQAQIQAGVLELKTKMFNLPDLLEKNRQLLDVLFKQKNLSYALNIASNVPTEIHGDPDRLHQVLVNLIGNAIKFTAQGGIQVHIFLQNKNQLAIAVEDSGPGIVEEHLPDIFEAFRRGSDYAQREQQGAGLGLSITREIITRMGGDISVVSALGKGSTFTVSIPI